jgi:UDP-N-acetylmuramate dehydrogenase
MSLFSDLDDITRFDEPMASHTSFGVGGRVSYFIEPRDWDELQLIYSRAAENEVRVRVLGRGCNTLVADGDHPWAVVSTRRLDRFQRQGNRLEVGAGYDLARLVTRAEALGLAGFEALAGIPGSVGGAVAMNAGGRHGTIGERLVSAVVALPGHAPRWMRSDELGLSYRGSNLVDGQPFLFSATFELETAPPRHLQEQRRFIIREKRASQPMDARSAGCVFKNPKGTSAGYLIDQAGLKGTSVGGAVVSHKHANFIVNRGDASATDIVQLIDIVVERVQEKLGIRLELEIEVWTDEL